MNDNENVVEVEEVKEETSIKDDVEKKIRKQIEKKQEKNEKMGIYRVFEYMKEEHKWENYLFIAISLVTLILGCLILNDDSPLFVDPNVPLIGDYPDVFAWVLIIFASVLLLYGLYPIFKPAFPEFKKITWLTMPKFLGNVIRVFIFLIVFTLLLYLYSAFIIQILKLVWK